MADTKSSARVSPTSSAAPSGAPSGGPSLGQRALAFFRPAPGAAGAARRPQSSTSRFIMGSVIFIFVAEVITYGLDYANLQFKLNLQQPLLGPSATWFTPFFVINVVVILGLWILLNRLGFFPRDMWNARRNVNTTRGAASGGKSGAGAGGSNGKSASAIPGIGKARTRAERRYTATASAAQAAASAKNGKQRAAAQTTARGASAEADFSTENDSAYDRARAAQRQRKRRALR